MQIALGVVGGVIGGFFGGPAGAEAGFLVGSTIGSLISPPKQPALPDLKIQTSAYGKYIPSIWGRYRVAGNVIWAGPATQSTVSKKKQPQEEAFVPLAIALCSGPIQGVTRIWANNKIVYDITNPASFTNLSGSAQMLSGFTVYLGDETQEPDPTMESYLGTGNVPAYRGLAYVVFSNLGLLSYGNVIPQLEFEVIQQPGLAWSGGVISTWTYVTSLGTITAAHNLTATGGTATGYGFYYGYNGFAVSDMNGYTPTALTSDVLHPSPTPNGCGTATGYSDVAGMIGGGAWYYADGAVQLLPGVSLPICAQDSSFVRDGNDLYYTAAYGGGNYPISRVELTNGTLVTTSTLQQPFLMVGCSADFVYALGTMLYQFDRDTLVQTNAWTVPTFTGTAGFVLNDDSIWICGAHLFQFQPSSGTVTNYGVPPFSPMTLYMASNGFAMMSTYGYNSVTLGYMALAGMGAAVPLSEIVSDVCLGTGLQGSQYDVSTLTDTVIGYCVTAYASGRSALEQLMSLYFFDAVDSEAKVKFVKRGGSSVVTIPWADIGVKASGGASDRDPIQETISDATELPRTLILSYKGSSNDYQLAAQRAFRSTTESNYDATAQVNAVLMDGEAATRAQSMLWTSWMNRRSQIFGTNTSYLQYEPTDVVTLTDADGTLYTVRLTKCEYDGKGALSWAAAIEGQTYPNLSQFTASGGQSVGVPQQALPYSGPSILAVIDTPPLRSQDVNPGLYMAACGYDPSWPGITVEVSRDNNTFSSVTNLGVASTIGTTATTMPAFLGGNQPDELSTVTVELANGSLSSVSYATFLSGTNLALIGTELVAFRTATQLSANTYELTGFLRGVSGTGNQETLHAVGERFVFLDPTTLFYESIFQTDVGNTLYYEYQLGNQFYAQPQPGAQDTVVNGCVKPLSPVQFVALHGSASSLSDITLNWLRRARVNAGWNDGTDVPLDEPTESYQLQVLNGATLVRTIVVVGPFIATGAPPSQYQGNPTAIYTAAMITADGFTGGQTITFTVAQNSGQGVLGWAATTTITR